MCKIACKECVTESKDELIKSCTCNNVHEKKDMELQNSKLAERLIQDSLADLFNYVEEKLTASRELLKSIIIKNDCSPKSHDSNNIKNKNKREKGMTLANETYYPPV